PVGRAQQTPVLQALPGPTPGNAKIWQALAEKTEFEFDGHPLRVVVDWVKSRHEIEVQLDMRALEDAGLGSDTPVTRVLQDISLRSALRLTLGEYELTYVVRDGYLLITSKTEAENLLVSKVYQVGDLVATKSDFQTPSRSARRSDPYRTLMQMVSETIAPDTWDDVGGPGSIEAFRNGESLVISQTSEAHEEIAEFLAALRKTRDKQRAVAAAIARRPEKADDARPEMRVKVYRLAFGAPTAGRAGRGMMGGGMAPMGRGMGGGGMGMMNHQDLTADAPPDEPQANDEPANQAPADKAAAEVNDAAAKPQPSQPKPAPPSKPASAAPPMFDPKQVEAWADELAALLPELVEPESWQPRGNGVARAAAGTIIVRQTAEIHEEVAELLGKIVPFSIAPDPGADPARDAALPPLATPGPQANWPQEAEPRPAGAVADIEQALDQSVEFAFEEAPLRNVADKLKAQYGIDVQLDMRALEDAGVGSDTPITRQLKNVSLREALKLLLGEFELTYVIRNEVLLITSKTEAGNMLITKVYPVFDLVVCSGDEGHERSPLNYGPLKSLVQSIVAPTSWGDVGGPGALEEFPIAGALVISQTMEVHEEIAQQLRALRAAATPPAR
ncbi:MAG TPA: hypothetical protein VFW87_18175, partial [Pirellulales bacterium]|nr:hypothetical protein [Pirellulales bacterium]